MQQRTTRWSWRWVCAALMVIGACFLAAVLWRWEPPFVSYTWRSRQLFELFGFAQTLALLGVAALFIPLCREVPERYVPLGAFLCMAFFYLTVYQSISTPTYDYRCWMNGMISHLAYGHPYSLEHSPSYWYPPLMAQSLAWGHEAIASLYRGDYEIDTGRSGLTYQLLFYAYQCTQYLLLLASFWLVYGFGRYLSMNRSWSAAAAFLLVLLNAPLFRLLVFQQPNLWLLVSIMIMLLMWERSAWITGLALALGFHIKLYPAALGLPLLLTGRWRALFWGGFFVAAVIVWQTQGLTNIALWTNFLEQIAQPRWGSFFRDNSIHGIVKNILKLFDLQDHDVLPTRIVTVAAVAGMLSRLVRRERLFRHRHPNGVPAGWWPARARFGDHAMDTLIMSFFMSPIVFEHHYVMAIPIILWTARYHVHRAPWRVLFGSILILWIPIYDVAPFGWNRMAGLLLLLSARPWRSFDEEPPWPPSVPQQLKTAAGP